MILLSKHSDLPMQSIDAKVAITYNWCQFRFTNCKNDIGNWGSQALTIWKCILHCEEQFLQKLSIAFADKWEQLEHSL